MRAIQRYQVARLLKLAVNSKPRLCSQGLVMDLLSVSAAQRKFGLALDHVVERIGSNEFLV